MTQVDVRTLRAQARFAQMDYDRQVREQAGAPSQDFSDCGAPSWNQASWDAFHAQYGHWPFSANELPPSMDGCPAWAFERMGLRVPPVQVNNGV